MIIIGTAGTTLANAGLITSADAIDDAAEVKVYSNATLEDDFADDRVLVVLSNKASLQFSTFQADEFTEIACAGVEDLSQSCAAKVKAQVETLMQTASVSSTATSDVNMDEIETFNQVLSLTIKEPGKQNVLDAVNALMSRDDVIYAGPDYIYTTYAIGDENFNGSPIAAALIDLSEAWSLTTGSEDVWVGVIDTGIDATHPDLVNVVDVSLSGEFFYETPVIGESTDSHGHGTHVAGIIGAASNAAEGTAGVCPNVKIISLRCATGSDILSSSVQRAINYAQTIGIPILNFSAGWIEGDNRYDTAMEATIGNYSGLFVCAAGNLGKNNDEYPDYPSSLNLPNLLSVGACDFLDRKWEYSNWGNTTVDIFAPGANIKSTFPNGNYGIMSGTSMAAPYVTGVAALMLSLCPDLTAEEIKARILLYADQVVDFCDECPQVVRLNAYTPLLYVHTWECDPYNTSNHRFYCSCGVERMEAHNWAYNLYNMSYHRATCDCGANILEAHTWVAFGTKYSCNVCRQITNAIPEILQSLNPERTACENCSQGENS